MFDLTYDGKIPINVVILFNDILKSLKSFSLSSYAYSMNNFNWFTALTLIIYNVGGIIFKI